MSLQAYRHLLRATRIAFAGDERVLSAARNQVRSGFREKASLSPSDPAVGPAVQHAEEVAEFLRANVVQGRKEADDRYSTSRSFAAHPSPSTPINVVCISEYVLMGLA